MVFLPGETEGLGLAAGVRELLDATGLRDADVPSFSPEQPVAAAVIAIVTAHVLTIAARRLGKFALPVNCPSPHVIAT